MKIQKKFEEHYPVKIHQQKGFNCILAAERATQIAISVVETKNTILNINLDVDTRIGKMTPN